MAIQVSATTWFSTCKPRSTKTLSHSIVLEHFLAICFRLNICRSLLYPLYRQISNQDEKEEASKKIRALEQAKLALENKLYAAKKLIDQVMSDGGKLLDTYHLEYSDIDFGGEDVEERCKLGEGAQVLSRAPNK